MVTPIFDYDQFYQLIERFALDVPVILGGHPATADLVPRVHGLLDAVETTFTVAVVGQMRSGKSSLLNALVGADLAVTDVNETTATINWFKYGVKEQCNLFRVIWKDRPAEDFPRSEIGQWIGNSERAKATRYIEFFAEAEFLRQANVVDTPGTRSVIEFHGKATEEFLATRHDVETRRQGGAADAIVYVLMPVPRQTDQDLLGDFEQNTRLPGASPYNSLAVVHKWETMGVDDVDDPLAEIQRKAQRIGAVMGDLVSAVVPVSAPLARAAEQFPDSFWSQILNLAANCPDEVLEELLLTDRDFLQTEEPRCPLQVSDRQSLHSTFKLPWPSLKVIIRHAQRKRPANLTDLRQAIREASGIDVLRSQLQRRFFARSRMIKAFSVLSKALEPCTTAEIRLQNHKLRYARLLEAAQDAMRSISDLASPIPGLESVHRYLKESRSLVEDECQKATNTLRRLGEIVVTLRDAYDDMNKDLQMLEHLDADEDVIGEEWSHKLRYLFGHGGPDIVSRIAPLCQGENMKASLDVIENAIGRLKALGIGSKGSVCKLLDHAVARLGQIADWREECLVSGTFSEKGNK